MLISYLVTPIHHKKLRLLTIYVLMELTNNNKINSMFKYQNREVSKGSMHSGKETTWDGSYLSTAASVQYPYVQLRLVAVRFCFC